METTPAKTRTAKVAPAADAAPAPARMGKKALIAQVVAATGGKPSAVKPIVEATLAALGEALAKGEGMVLPPIGRLTVRQPKEGKTPKSMTVRVRPAGAGRAGKGKQALAEADEDN